MTCSPVAKVDLADGPDPALVGDLAVDRMAGNDLFLVGGPGPFFGGLTGFGSGHTPASPACLSGRYMCEICS